MPVPASLTGVTAAPRPRLSLACNLRAASDKATFREAFIRVGLARDSVTRIWLRRLLGNGRAPEVGLLPWPRDPQNAMRLGIVHWVSPHGKCRNRTDAVPESLSNGRTKAMGLRTRALNSTVLYDLESELKYEVKRQHGARMTMQDAEAVNAFFDEAQPECFRQ